MHASGGGLCTSARSSSPGRWVRPWPGAPRCWPRLRSERGLSCCSLLRPNSFLDSTAPVERSLESWVSSVSIRRCDPFTALRSRPFSLDSDLIIVFWRRDRRSALRSSASMPDSIFRQRLPGRAKPRKPGFCRFPARLRRLHRPAQPGVLLAQPGDRGLLAPRPPKHIAHVSGLVERQSRQRRPRARGTWQAEPSASPSHARTPPGPRAPGKPPRTAT